MFTLVFVDMKLSSLQTESVALTFRFLRANKLRSFLSVLGVTIGISCIVSIFTATHSLEKNIRNNVDKLGDKIIYVQKWPWSFGKSYKWWEYMNRPKCSIKEYRRFVKDANPKVIKNLAFFYEFKNNRIKSNIQELNDVKIVAILGDFFDINQWDIVVGRAFNDVDIDMGKNTAILGYNVAINLFEGKNPVGKSIKINGSKVTVIGVLDYQGSSIGGAQYDDIVVLGNQYAQRFAKASSNGSSPSIVIKGFEETTIDALSDEVRRIMRSVRRIKPKDSDNFALNKLTMVSDSLNQTFGMIDIAAGIIGFFSLLVGGFGIANIMFVSVKERTSIIGLQKALGAKRVFILSQFLFESVMLCVIGALIAILLVMALGLLASYFTSFQIFFSLSIFTVGISIAVVIGIIAGISPALLAARMDPVVALRK